MSNEEVIVEAQRELAFLVRDMEFCGPDLVHDNCVTCLRYSRRDVGIEAELDWREKDALVLIVRLPESRWPKGYYIDNGRKCRIHLENAARERGWPTSVSVEASFERPSNKRMISEIARRARMLKELMCYIEAEIDSLFE